MATRGWRGTNRAVREGMKFDAYALSIAGRRTNNEDAVCLHPELGLFVVADGMGGYEGGEVASALAVETSAARAVGAAPAEPDVQRELVRRGDVFLLCTDGLSEVLDGARIAELLALPAEAACRALVDAAFDAGSRDNISAVVVRVC